VYDSDSMHNACTGDHGFVVGKDAREEAGSGARINPFDFIVGCEVDARREALGEACSDGLVDGFTEVFLSRAKGAMGVGIVVDNPEVYG
jgi:hypothetical protein